MDEILDLKKLDNALSTKWQAVSSAQEEAKFSAILEYLDFLKEQYEKGAMGYMMYPYYVTSLLSIDAEKYTELESILDLAAKLEIPNEHEPTNPRTRIEETEKLSEMIGELK